MAQARTRWLLIAAALVVMALGAALLFDLVQSGKIQLFDPSATRFPVRGVDVSHHQGPIAWDRVAAAGIEFAFIKTSEGQDFTDKRYAENWRQAGDAGIARGAYHFFTFCTSGSSQAEHFIALIESLPRELPPVVDVEFAGNCRSWTDIDEIRNELRGFVAQVEIAIGEAPVIYLTSDSHERIIAGHFPDHPLWVRNLFFEPHKRRYGSWLFWQFTDTARIDGIEGPVDLNVYCCSRAEYERLQSAPPAGSPVAPSGP